MSGTKRNIVLACGDVWLYQWADLLPTCRPITPAASTSSSVKGSDRTGRGYPEDVTQAPSFAHPMADTASGLLNSFLPGDFSLHSASDLSFF